MELKDVTLKKLEHLNTTHHRIHSMELKGSGGLRRGLGLGVGIHSMELKGVGTNLVLRPKTFENESIQWN